MYDVNGKIKGRIPASFSGCYGSKYKELLIQSQFNFDRLFLKS
jgi:hypothetical protein